jgi:hypothetical protein
LAELHRICVGEPVRRCAHKRNGVAVLLGRAGARFRSVVQHFVRIELRRDRFHAARFDLGEIENFVDQAEEVLGRGEDAVEILHRCGVAAIFGVFLQHLRIADDGVERGAQFVAHIGQELRLGEIGAFGGVARMRQ